MGDVLVNGAQQLSAAVALVLVGYGGDASGLQIQSFEAGAQHLPLGEPNSHYWRFH